MAKTVVTEASHEARFTQCGQRGEMTDTPEPEQAFLLVI
jgi:hypothetical protein